MPRKHEDQFYNKISPNAQRNCSGTSENHISESMLSLSLSLSHTHTLHTQTNPLVYIINANHLAVSRNRDKRINHSPDGA